MRAQPLDGLIDHVLKGGSPAEWEERLRKANGANPGFNGAHKGVWEQRVDAAPLIMPSAKFVHGFVPPDYLIDGLLQRRFCYSLTAPTGAGKTAIALLLSTCVALGRPIGGREIEQGRVLYLAGENPDDVRMRWIAMAEHMGFDIAAIDVHFVPGQFSITELGERVRREADAAGGFSLVVADTSAAYFEGEDENNNVQMGAHARLLRSLATIPGEPTVLAACHPVKNAASDNLVPRGGGAFLAEVDGNLTCSKNDTLVTLHWQGKFRGPDFAPITFETRAVTAERLKDSKGRPITTVLAQMISDEEQTQKAANARSDEDAMLVELLDFEGNPTPTSMAASLNWLDRKGAVAKMRGKRTADRLKKAKLVTDERGALVLTERGTKAAKQAKYNVDAAGATYGLGNHIPRIDR